MPGAATIAAVTAFTGDVASVTVTATSADSSFFHADPANGSASPASRAGALCTTTFTVGGVVSRVTTLAAEKPTPASQPAMNRFCPSDPVKLRVVLYVLEVALSRGTTTVPFGPVRGSDAGMPPSADTTVTSSATFEEFV
jgi:hypothetical protein